MNEQIFTRLGKLDKVTFGYGGYQDAQLGIHFQISGSGWGTCDSWGFWGPSIECSEHAKWTEEDRHKFFGEVMMRIGKLLDEAKVATVDKLNGVPIECTFKGGGMGVLSSWRVLTEVL